VIPCCSLRYSKCSVDISSSHIFEVEAKAGEMQTAVAPAKVKRGESVLPSDAERGTEVIFLRLVKEGKSSGFKPLCLPFSLFLCLTDGKSGAENCFAQSHTLAVIELADNIGLNRKCTIYLYYSGCSNCCLALLSMYAI